MSLVARISALDASDTRVLGSAALRLIAWRIALGLLPFRVVHGMLMRSTVRGSARIKPERAAWAIAAAARRMPGTKCLARSFALLSLLRAYGADGEVRIGVMRSGARGMAAHSWVESGGFPLEDPSSLRDFVAFPSVRR